MIVMDYIEIYKKNLLIVVQKYMVIMFIKIFKPRKKNVVWINYITDFFLLMLQ